MKSIVCKNCLPEELQHRKDLRGYWEVDKERGVAKCSNCGFERPFTRRKASNKITPAQQKAIDRIEHYFKDWRSWENEYKHNTLYRLEVESTDYGTVWVRVEDVENYLIQQGGLFYIGKRGAITVHQSYELSGDNKSNMKHYAKMLHGKVSKI